MNTVVMQPQFFPWRGLFEQIHLCDEFVHLDDAQFQKGGMTNRIQIKTANGPFWFTVPVLRGGHLPPINETEIDYRSDWRGKTIRTFEMSYARAPFLRDAIALLTEVYDPKPATIGALDIAAIERCAAYLGLQPTFSLASQTPVTMAKTDRLVGLLGQRGTKRYITGLGALDYLDEPMLAAQGIEVRVMSYERTPYPQLHGPFDPHVSILDTIANLGPAAAASLTSPTIAWHDAKRMRTA